MLIFKDGRVADYRTVFSNTSFPASGPSDDFLKNNNAYRVSLFKDYDRVTQKLVSCAPYIEGDWAYTVKVEDKTEADMQAELDSKAAKLRAQRDEALKASDWTQVLDAPVDRTAWAAYRQALRDLPSNPNFPNVDLPSEPGSNNLGEDSVSGA